MNLKLFLTLIYLLMPADCLLTITKVNMRPPKEFDIGFIFDVDILNADGTEKAALDLLIKGETCVLELRDNQTLSRVPKLFGGHFGRIQPGAAISVSTFWPTTVLFNRKGYCDMVVFRSKNESTKDNQLFHRVLFDTTLTSTRIPKIMETYMSGKKIKDCPSIDLNPFQNCRPMNCEEKYFGQRNYFNTKCKVCEPVPVCTCPNSIYDCLHNECYNSAHLLTKNDIKMIKEGHTREAEIKRSSNSDDSDDFDQNTGQFYFNTADDLLNLADKEEYFSFLNSIHWWGVIDGFLIASATVAIYLMICFCVFVCVNMLTSKPTARKSNSLTFKRADP